jgi:hypothetical protein
MNYKIKKHTHKGTMYLVNDDANKPNWYPSVAKSFTDKERAQHLLGVLREKHPRTIFDLIETPC